MPFSEVMKKYHAGKLRSGGNGAVVSNPKQATAILLSEKKKAEEGKTEYQAPERKGGLSKMAYKKRG